MITAAQREVADRVIAEEGRKRAHLVVALSGAHAYGFPSPDSDLDLKAVHIAPTQHFLGLPRPLSACERMEVIDGVEIDYSSNEIGVVVAGVLAGNGNYIERICGALLLDHSGELDELASLTRASFSRRVFRHYVGFATSQRRALEAANPTAKQLLYVLRTALTGIHLLRAGELRVELGPNLSEYGYAEAEALIARKRSGERVGIGQDDLDAWRGRLAELFAELSAAHEHSVLPAEPPNGDALEAWLIAARIAAL